MGAKDIIEAGSAFEPLVRINRSLVSFINTNEADAIAIRQAYDKPLDTVTNQDIIDKVGDVIPTQETIDEIKTELAVLQQIIDVVKPLRDNLPATDY